MGKGFDDITNMEPKTMDTTYEIRRAKNGYCIWIGSFFNKPGPTMEQPYVFETLENALIFLKIKFTELENREVQNEI